MSRLNRPVSRASTSHETPALTDSHAIGAGLGLAMACDLRIVANDARLGFTFATLGLHPGMACTFTTRKVRQHEEGEIARREPTLTPHFRIPNI